MSEPLKWVEDAWYARFLDCDLRIKRENGDYVLTAKTDGQRTRRLGNFLTLASAKRWARGWAATDR